MAQEREVTREDVESLAEKLDAFAASLTESERAVLSRVVSVAAVATESGESDVQGFDFSSPLAVNLARGANFVGNQLAVPRAHAINPGKLVAKDEEQFQGFLRR